MTMRGEEEMMREGRRSIDVDSLRWPAITPFDSPTGDT
jgi:hypothetical protein